MPRHGGHLHADHISQFLNAPLTMGQFVHDEQPRGMGEGFEDPRLGLEIGWCVNGHISCLHI